MKTIKYQYEVALKQHVKGSVDDFSDYITQREISDLEVIGNIHEDEWKQYRKYFPN